MSRVYLLVCLFLFSLTTMHAQFGQGGCKEIKKIKETETLVVLGYHHEYNEAIQEIFNHYWTFTKFRFIPGSHYKRYCDDPQYSFVMLFTIKEWQVIDEAYDDIGIVLGGNCSTGPYDMVGYANLDVFTPKQYKLESKRAVQLMQNYLEMGLEAELPKENHNETIEMYNARHAEMGEKPLWICQEDVIAKFATREKIAKHYEQEFHLKTQYDVDVATWEDQKEILYTKIIYDVAGYTYLTIIQAKDSKVVFTMPTENHEAYLMGPRSLGRMSELTFGLKAREFNKGF